MAPLNPPPKGILSVTIYEGKGLKDMDTFGKNDAFIELWIDKKHKQRTSEVQNTNDPVWNETFAFDLTENENTQKLYLSVHDNDILDKDEIGQATIDLKHVLSGNPKDDWIKLPSMFGLSDHGQIRLHLEFTAR